MTGIEVISNAVPVFQPPEADNARKTLSVMIVLLVAMCQREQAINSRGAEGVLADCPHRSATRGGSHQP